MPIYEYRCKDCGSEFEYQQRMSEAAKTQCERCAGVLEKLISRSSFHLKGSGWYKDLYASPKPANGASPGASETGSASTGESKPAGTSETKSETKPATPAPAS